MGLEEWAVVYASQTLKAIVMIGLDAVVIVLALDFR